MDGSRTHVYLLLGALLGVVGGCVREPVEQRCLEPGSLFISELRGDSGDDVYGEWIELYNASDEAVPLGGLKLRSYSIQNDQERLLLILDGGELELSPGGYAVIGSRDNGSLEFLDYAFHDESEDNEDAPYEPGDGLVRSASGDSVTSFFTSLERVDPEQDDPKIRRGVLELSSCGVELDRVNYTLNQYGSLALDGVMTPGSDTYRDAAPTLAGPWCADTRGDMRGSPGEANPTCAELAVPEGGETDGT